MNREYDSLVQNLLQRTETSPDKEIVVICIGTDRSTGDAYGPLVGTFLSEMELSHLTVYGTVDHPVHGMNLESALQKIASWHKDAFIIAVDAALGKPENMEKILFSLKPLRPGAGVGKNLTEVGNCSIVGVVNVRGFDCHEILGATRLSTSMRMAKQTAEILREFDQALDALPNRVSEKEFKDYVTVNFG